MWGTPWRYNKPLKSALHPFLLCERLILHRGWAINEWTLLFWTISVRYLLNNPNNYENRGGCYRPYYILYYCVRSPLKFMVWFSTLQLNSKFCTLPYHWKTFLHFSFNFWTQLFYLTVLGVHFQLALSNYTVKPCNLQLDEQICIHCYYLFTGYSLEKQTVVYRC